MCQKQVPLIPPELRDYIVGCYCELRKESRAEENKNTTTFTSARTLLAILRLSTALARLRTAQTVEKDDVGEAIRLMEMSKDSLKAAPATSRGQQEVDRVYQFILQIAEGSKTIKVQDIRDRATSKGFKPDAIDRCLEEYESLDVAVEPGPLQADHHQQRVEAPNAHSFSSEQLKFLYFRILHLHKLTFLGL